MAVVLAAGGFLLYHHLATSLDRTISQGLRSARRRHLRTRATGGHRTARLAAPCRKRQRLCAGARRTSPDLRPDTVSRRAPADAGAIGAGPTRAARRRPRDSDIGERATACDTGLRAGEAPGCRRRRAPRDKRQRALDASDRAARRRACACSSHRSSDSLLFAAGGTSSVEECGQRRGDLGEPPLRASAVAPSEEWRLHASGETLNEMLGPAREGGGTRAQARRRREPRAENTTRHLRAEVELALEAQAPSRSTSSKPLCIRLRPKSDRLSQLAEDSSSRTGRLDKGTVRSAGTNVELDDLVDGGALRFDLCERLRGRSSDAQLDREQRGVAAQSADSTLQDAAAYSAPGCEALTADLSRSQGLRAATGRLSEKPSTTRIQPPTVDRVRMPRARCRCCSIRSRSTRARAAAAVALRSCVAGPLSRGVRSRRRVRRSSGSSRLDVVPGGVLVESREQQEVPASCERAVGFRSIECQRTDVPGSVRF